MLLHDVVKQVDLTKRAVKFYEEKGLLQVPKDANGYRNYTAEHIRILKEISAYRKLGIGLPDIRELLKDPDKKKLRQIYDNKKRELSSQEQELSALQQFLSNQNAERLYEQVDYSTIAQAITDMIPGYYGYFFMRHFLPYLQIPLETEEQKEAYDAILRFWDTVSIRIPLFLRFSAWMQYHLTRKSNLDVQIQNLDRTIQMYLHPTEEEYHRLREQTRKNVMLRNSLFYKYHPVFISQRRFMRRLQDCGYNDIFIPNMIALSPKYKEYHEALSAINERICRDLGLYYDSDYHLVIKKTE